MKKILIFILTFFALSFCFSQVTNPWLRSGNTLQNNTDFIGTKNSRSLIFKTNNNLFLKLDSLGNFFWKQSSANLASLQGLVSFTTIPAFYIGVSTPTIDNYAILADGTNNVFNAPTTLSLRTKNTTFLQASTTPTISAELITFPAINIPTVSANNNITHLRLVGNTIGFNAGTTPIQAKMLISADTYSANASSTITNSYGLWVVKPIQGTNMTLTNISASRFDGNVLNNGSLRVGSTVTPAYTLDVTGNANISSSLTTNGIANTGTITSDVSITTPTLYGSSASGGTLTLGSTSNATKGYIVLGAGTGTTTIPAGQTFSLGSANLTGGNTGTVAVVSDNIFSFQFGWSVQSPADATTYWLNNSGVFNANMAGQGKIVLPVACTLIGYSFNNINLGSNGSAETATLNVRKNGTTTTALSTSITYSATSTTSDFTKNISFSVGDDFVPNILCPTWVTNPVQSVTTIVFYFKRQ